MTGTPRLTLVASAIGGRVLATATRGMASLRSAAKPLHPKGEVYAGRLHRHGTGAPSGVPWLDETGEDTAVVRLSRAIGLPEAVPDIHGLAVRVHTADGPADLLFATTGSGRLTRFLLTPSRDPRSRPLTTLLPYRTASGPVLLCAQSIDETTYELCWSRPSGAWSMFGTLHLSTSPGEDLGISFDPVLNQVPGLDQYAVVRSLREPSYFRARHSRADVHDGATQQPH